MIQYYEIGVYSFYWVIYVFVKYLIFELALSYLNFYITAKLYLNKYKTSSKNIGLKLIFIKHKPNS